ncbi:MAG TPA: glycoside hydrolase family 13 protein [Cyclobacteriaceae bacterium]
MKSGLLLIFFLLPLIGHTQSLINRIEPPFWWIGMRNTELQLLIYKQGVGQLKPEINHKGVELLKTQSVENKNFLFLYLQIEPRTAPGRFTIYLKDGKGRIIEDISYQLRSRVSNAPQLKGYDNADVMYLITPDRFANGDPENDNIPGMPEQMDRTNKWGRHGGDLRGIINNLDYLKDMGFTAIWLNPVLENNQPEYSYHGYSTTDYYKVDPRFGSNEEYQELVSSANEKGIKIIMDMIMNHCGSEHWWMSDLPSNEWINNPTDFFMTSHRRTTLRDPYASTYDERHFTDGWFVPTMPDLNQRNPLVADYLIQNTIWWIESTKISGIRMDTYPYSDKDFMSDWTCEVMTEYPDFNICGEEWSLNPAVLAYWQKGKQNPDGYTSCLPGLLDFPLQSALVNALNEEEAWNKGMVNLYTALSNDFLYADPFKHVIFPDNHDMSRIFSQLNEDVELFRLAMVYFATMRGTPQLYYGTEILMSNTGDDSHGNIRSDFPGGWAGDEINAFQEVGLTKEQEDAMAFLKNLLNWRKTATAVHEGSLKHFAPQKGVYTYFRYNEEEKIMVILNKTNEIKKIGLDQFKEIMGDAKAARNVLSQNEISLGDSLSIGAKQPLILKLK